MTIASYETDLTDAEWAILQPHLPARGKQVRPPTDHGLLCSSQGCPVAIEVFNGNTADSPTLPAQIQKIRQRFGIKRVVLVGTGRPVEKIDRRSGSTFRPEPRLGAEQTHTGWHVAQGFGYGSAQLDPA